MSRCRGCGAEVQFRRDVVTNKMIPLQKVPLYIILEKAIDLDQEYCEPAGNDRFFVSHFLTCPAAGRFNGRPKEKKHASS